jgi:hypothetical protein
VLGGRSRQLGELHEGDEEHRGAERDEPAACTPAPEVGADANEEEHAGEEHGDSDVAVGGLAGGHACGERLVGLLVPAPSPAAYLSWLCGCRVGIEARHVTRFSLSR